MNIIVSLLIVIIAGVLQGTFILPMTYTKKWEWAHNWFAFSLLAMLILNWIIALIAIPHLTEVISKIPSYDLLIVLLFGLGWGVGAILFGKGMKILGMALGFPIIMGINATAGSLIPAIIFSPTVFLQTKGLFIIIGTVLTVFGIIICGKASAKKTSTEIISGTRLSGKGLTIAITAGFASCLPNLGAAFSGEITDIALQSGVNPIPAGNIVWSLFFSAGFIANAVYCLYLTNKDRNTGQFFNEYKVKNWLLIFAMSLMWIGSFYFYGISSSMLGKFGLIIGWPLFIVLSIIVGNLWGIYRGEWKDSALGSRRLLNTGLLVLIVSVIFTALSNQF